MPLTALLNELNQAQVELAKPSNLPMGAVEDDHNTRLCERENSALTAIARYRATTPNEFLTKLKLMLDTMERERMLLGYKLMIKLHASLRTDINRLFEGDRDAELLRLIADYRANDAAVEALMCTVTDAESQEAKWERATDLRFTLFRKIARKRAKTLTGAALQAAILPYHVERAAGSATDDHVERYVANLVAGLNKLAGIEPVIAADKPAMAA